ncbi:MAG: PadR family transcriptional regulator [Candidatus Aenigmatarchaeota archaeon]
MVKPSERLERSLTVDNLWQYILRSLRKPKYAYELAKGIKNANMVTVYAVLYKLEIGGYVKRAFSGKGGGPTRKYYVATKKGLEELRKGKAIIKNHLKRL